jgi:hypothetical protein
VTGLALIAQTVFVFVIFAMAGNTGLAGLFPVRIHGVACAALCLAVFAVQRIFGVVVMLEDRIFPRFCVVATLALLAIHSFVTLFVVIFLMA